MNRLGKTAILASLIGAAQLGCVDAGIITDGFSTALVYGTVMSAVDEPATGVPVEVLWCRSGCQHSGADWNPVYGDFSTDDAGRYRVLITVEGSRSESFFADSVEVRAASSLGAGGPLPFFAAPDPGDSLRVDVRI